RMGTFGDVGVYSASSVKTLDTYGGGLVVTSNEELAKSLRKAQEKLSRPSRIRLMRKIFTDLVRNLASQPLVFTIATFPLIRLLAKRGNSEFTKFTGDRDRNPLQEIPRQWFESYTSVQAAVGLQQLKQVDSKDKKRIAAISELNSLHNFTDRPTGADGGSNIYWQYIVYADEFKHFQQELFSQNIDCATTSLVKVSGLEKYPYQAVTPNADRLFTNGVYLPCYHQLTKSQRKRIGAALSKLAQTL
ncbi:MAG: DegT/DnrJ/EryC1/StrS family aminotransferase, partial [Ilumatobacteraceae bacterium]